MKSTTPMPSKHESLRAWRRSIMWIALGAACLWLLQLLVPWTMNFISDMNAISGRASKTWVLTISILIYALLIATPFMPGIEVGIALLLLNGAWMAPLVYLATVVGLMTAFAIGHFVPLPALQKFFADIGLHKVSTYIATIEATPPQERLAAQRAMLPVWIAKLTIDYRYITMGALLNIPGTFAIGGGGGILMAAGLSRLFRGWVVFATVTIATLPIPLAVWIMGVAILPQ